MAAHLTHYIIVRRDLPFGVTMAMVAHAAGESAYWFSRGSSVKEHLLDKQEVGGSSPSLGAISDATVVVLGARNESRLIRLRNDLASANIMHVAIRETDGVYAGQLMAIGLWPGSRDELGSRVADFGVYREMNT